MIDTNTRTIGVGKCRVCGKGRSLLKTHICLPCRKAEENTILLKEIAEQSEKVASAMDGLGLCNSKHVRH